MITKGANRCEIGCTCHKHPNGQNVLNTLHKRCRVERGNAKIHKCQLCDDMAFDWAQIHGTIPSEVNDFMPLCRSCHLFYDNAIGNTRRTANRKLNEIDVIVIREMLKAGSSQSNIGNIFGVSGTAIHRIKTGVAWAWVRGVG